VKIPDEVRASPAWAAASRKFKTKLGQALEPYVVGQLVSFEDAVFSPFFRQRQAIHTGIISKIEFVAGHELEVMVDILGIRIGDRRAHFNKTFYLHRAGKLEQFNQRLTVISEPE
jgi:hypothetical protein